MKKLIFVFLSFCCSAYSYVYDVEYISPEKRYSLEKQVYEVSMQKKGIALYAEFPDYFKWLQIQGDREKKFYDWLKAFLPYLSGDLDCPMSYYIWTCQNPTKF